MDDTELHYVPLGKPEVAGLEHTDSIVRLLLHMYDSDGVTAEQAMEMLRSHIEASPVN